MSQNRARVVRESWPPDGPYDDEAFASAARAMDQLSNYLTIATRKSETVPRMSTVADMLEGVAAATDRLDQLAQQLTRAVEWHKTGNGLYDDRRGRSGNKTAAQLVTELNDARLATRQAYRALDTARHTARHLGHG